MGRTISVVCNDGSPLGIVPATLWGDDFRIGLGGSEYLLITLCEEWAKKHDVILYNNPHTGNNAQFEQHPITHFDPGANHDIIIIFRSPNVRTIPANAKLKVWLSCDQVTIGDFKAFAKLVNKIVCISPFHAEYFKTTYGIENVHIIDIPVRLNDFEQFHEEKVPKRIIFTSVPARGLDNLQRIWLQVKRAVPDASLVITSDYRLWGVGASNEQFRVKWHPNMNGVDYIGAVSRARLIQEQMKAQILLYPCNYEELFCVAVAEAQTLGAYPVTSACGALATTNMGTVYNVNADDPHNDKLFADAVIELLNDPEHLKWLQETTMQKSRERFSVEKILEQWDEEIFE